MAGVEDTAATIRIAVAWSPCTGEACEAAVEVAAGSCALDAIRACGVLERDGRVDVSTQEVGIWGRVVGLDALLADGDRVEIYRPLPMDPKDARRQRARRR